MKRRDGWTGRIQIFVVALVAMVGIVLPELGQAATVTSRTIDVTIGGYVQMNGAWDSDEHGSTPSSMFDFAPIKGSPEEGRDSLRWVATRTRINLDGRGPTLWGAKTRAFIEFDFDGFQSTDSPSTPAHTPRLRHSYMRFDWPQFYVLIGQTTLLLSSAVSSAGEFEGITTRRGDLTSGSRNRTPQIQVGTAIPMGIATLDLKGSIGRNQASDRDSNSSFFDSGSRSGVPAVQGLAGARFKVFGRDGVFAASGYWGDEKLTNGAAERDLNNTAFVLEGLLPLGPAIPGIGAFDVRAGWFTAENMSAPNLGFNGRTSTNAASVTPVPEEIGADGWWAEVNWNPTPDLIVGAGFGRTEDDKGDVRKIGGTTQRVLENEGWWIHAAWTSGPFLFGVLYGQGETTRIVPSTGAKFDSDIREVLFVFRFNI